MIPLHALVLLLMGRFTGRLYVAYSSWYAIGTLSSMQVPFVGFQPVRTSEHMAALGTFIIPVSCIIFNAFTGVFGLLQIVAFAQLVRAHVSSKQFQELLFTAVISLGLIGFFGIVGLTYKGWIAPWTGRFYSLWDTGYAKKYVKMPAHDPPLLTRYSGTSLSLLQYPNTNLPHGPRSSWTCTS
jgi:dolichyl-diphosphooligosaccharide--protein glycosyltransferase